MKGFQFNPAEGEICPVCGKNTVKDSVFIPRVPLKENDPIDLVQIHMDCLVEGLALYPGREKSIVGKEAPFYTLEDKEVDV